MKTKAIILVLFACVLIGGSIGWLFYYESKVKATHIGFEFATEAPVATMPNPTKDNWLDNLKHFNKAYSYPAQEFEIFVDFVDPEIKAIPQKIFISAVDQYLFFCLNELFKQRNIEFAYSKNTNSIDLVVYIPEEYIKAQQLIKELQYYEVPYTYQ